MLKLLLYIYNPSQVLGESGVSCASLVKMPLKQGHPSKPRKKISTIGRGNCRQ